MGALDAILDRMAARNADSLHLRVGEIPAVLAKGRTVPIKKEPLTEQQWTALVHEVAGPHAIERIALREPCNFSHRGFVFQVSFDQDVPSCEARPTTDQDIESKPAGPSEIALEIEPLEARRMSFAPVGHTRPVSSLGPPGAPTPKATSPAVTSGAGNPGFFRTHRGGLVVGALLLAVVIAATLWWMGW
jgi:hypothetical protein